MECKLSKSRKKSEEVARLDGQEIPKSKSSRYLGSIIHKSREIEENVNHSVKTR